MGFRVGTFGHASDYTPMTPVQRRLLLNRAEAYERETKRPGCVNGAIGQPGIRVFRALLEIWHNSLTGRCDPSYDTIQEKTGLSRQSVATGIAKARAAGFLRVTRRMGYVMRDVLIAGTWTRLRKIEQRSNAYGFPPPIPPIAEMLAREGRKHFFPIKPRQSTPKGATEDSVQSIVAGVVATKEEADEGGIGQPMASNTAGRATYGWDDDSSPEAQAEIAEYKARTLTLLAQPPAAAPPTIYPTTRKAGRPLDTWTWTSTGTASTPAKAKDWTRARLIP